MHTSVENQNNLDDFRDSARRFLENKNTLQRVRDGRTSAIGVDRHLWSAIAELGWTSIVVSEESGGLGLGLSEASIIAQEVGAALYADPFVASAVHVGLLLDQLGGSDTRTELLDRLISGDLVAAVAWQERLGQVEVETSETTIHPDGENVVLRSKKRFVPLGQEGDGWIVHATFPQSGHALVWIPSDTVGVSVDRSTLIDGSVSASITFEDAAVPRKNVLLEGRKAGEALTRANDLARIVLGAELLGLSRKIMGVTLEYMRTRVQFGKPIGSFQALKHRAVDVHMQIELAEACLREALADLPSSLSRLASVASRTKARASHAALLVGRFAIQMHGAMGITDECDVGLYFKRALALSSWMGNASAHKMRYLAAHAEESAGVQSNAPTETSPASGVDWNRMSDRQFREMVRAVLVAKYPQHLRHLPRSAYWEEFREWHQILYEVGWVAPAWPKEYGGMGLEPAKLLALHEEYERYGVARWPEPGITMLGPLLIKHGTPEQRAEYLPKILSAEQVWCQGYSEPNAGSDLASLRTEAVLEGDEFRVTGQKIWTSYAKSATHIFMLVRTDKGARKQEGISFLIADLKSPGITLRGIPDLVGSDKFCEIFFDGTRVPRDNLVGEINKGWTLAKDLLGFERLLVGSPKQAQYALGKLKEVANELGLFSDQAFLARYAEQCMDVADLCALYSHYAEIFKRGEGIPPDVAQLKIWSTETHHRIAMLIVESVNDLGATLEPALLRDNKLDVLGPVFTSIPSMIYGGTNEIQRNIVAKVALELPD